MARQTFLSRIQSMTRIQLSTVGVPNIDDIEEYMHQGVQDFYTRWTSINPQDIYMFSRESLLFDGTGGSGEDTYDPEAHFELKGGKILSVLRENGTASSFRHCRKISYSLQDRANDADSLHYASAYNPAYFVGNDNIVNVIRSAGTSGNSYKVLYTNLKNPSTFFLYI